MYKDLRPSHPKVGQESFTCISHDHNLKLAIIFCTYFQISLKVSFCDNLLRNNHPPLQDSLSSEDFSFVCIFKQGFFMPPGCPGTLGVH